MFGLAKGRISCPRFTISWRVEMKDYLKKIILSGILQAMLIGVVSIAIAFAANAIRGDGLPLINRIETRLPPSIDGASSNVSSVISLKDAFKRLNEKKAVFLDARDLHEFEKYHVPGAIHIEPGKTEDKVEKIKSISAELFIAYCYGPGCPLAEELAAELATKGIRNITVMPEGWDG
jgi:rhodanese-related sulfurtransferase